MARFFPCFRGASAEAYRSTRKPRMAKLTKRIVDAAVPQASDYFIHDDQLPGFRPSIRPRRERLGDAAMRGESISVDNWRATTSSSCIGHEAQSDKGCFPIALGAEVTSGEKAVTRRPASPGMPWPRRPAPRPWPPLRAQYPFVPSRWTGRPSHAGRRKRPGPANG